MPPGDKWLTAKLVHDGARLREVRGDLLRKDQPGRQRWFQGPEGCDLFLWYGEGTGLVQVQLTFAGRVIEWSEAEGLRTGKLVSFDPLHPEQDQGRLVFDRAAGPETLRLARALLEKASVDDVTLSLVRTHLGLR